MSHVNTTLASQPVGPQVCFITLGCAKNEVDSARMTRQVRAAGYAVVDNPEIADAVIINTCSFIQAATEESLDTIFEVCNLENFERGNARLVVAGCMPARYGDDLAGSLDEAAAFVPCSKEDNIVDVLGNLFKDWKPEHYEEVSTVDELAAWLPCAAAESLAPYDSMGNSNVATYVKISDGCDRFCSFCAIPYIRGRYHSFELDDIRETVAERIAEGAKEITLIAQDTGRWGEDFEPPLTTAFLLDTLATEFSDIWFRLMYCEPEGVSDELLEAIKKHDNICNYLDMPLQHASATVLKRMNRKGNADEFRALIEHIREMVPDITLRTTLIAGFPGETEEDFDELTSFLEEVELDYVGVFSYSPEEGTRGACLDGQIDDETKLERAQEIRDMSDAISTGKVAARIGSTVRVLVLGTEEDGQLFGRAQCQAPEVDGVLYIDKGTPGEFVDVEIIDTLAYEMEGEVVGE